MFSFPKKGKKTESFVSKGLARLSADAIRALSPALKGDYFLFHKVKMKMRNTGLSACLVNSPPRQDPGAGIIW